MNRSISFLRLLHKAYPVMVLSFAFMVWATGVQGEMGESSFHPPELPKSPSKLNQVWSPRACSVSPDSSFHSNFKSGCSIDEPKLTSSMPASALGHAVVHGQVN